MDYKEALERARDDIADGKHPLDVVDALEKDGASHEDAVKAVKEADKGKSEKEKEEKDKSEKDKSEKDESEKEKEEKEEKEKEKEKAEKDESEKDKAEKDKAGKPRFEKDCDVNETAVAVASRMLDAGEDDEDIRKALVEVMLFTPEEADSAIALASEAESESDKRAREKDRKVASRMAELDRRLCESDKREKELRAELDALRARDHRSLTSEDHLKNVGLKAEFDSLYAGLGMRTPDAGVGQLPASYRIGLLKGLQMNSRWKDADLGSLPEAALANVQADIKADAKAAADALGMSAGPKASRIDVIDEHGRRVTKMRGTSAQLGHRVFDV